MSIIGTAFALNPTCPDCTSNCGLHCCCMSAEESSSDEVASKVDTVRAEHLDTSIGSSSEEPHKAPGCAIL